MLNKPTVFRMITACLVLVLASACSVKRIAVNGSETRSPAAGRPSRRTKTPNWSAMHCLSA